jgi:selenocysteine lyase/cysteine desulfurase
MDIDIKAVRRQFPILNEKAYFNSCSYGPLALPVKAAVEQYLDIRMREGARWDIYCDKIERVRDLLGALLQTPADDVAVSTSVSESLNSLMSALHFDGARRKILVTDFDFPTTSQIMLAQAARGAEVVRARADASGTAIPLTEYERLIDEQTLLVAVPLVCYRNGAWVDIEPVVQIARERGALVLLDAYQGLGTRPFDAAGSGVDFVVGGCTKYLLGASGVGFMYVRDSRDNDLQPTATGWFAQENPHAMDIYHHLPHATARRFESGTPNACGLFAAEAGLKLLLETGLEQVGAQISRTTTQVKQAIEDNGWDLVTPRDRHGAMLAIRALDAPALVARLTARGIILTERDGNIRVASHYFNDEGDVQDLVSALQQESTLLA